MIAYVASALVTCLLLGFAAGWLCALDWRDARELRACEIRAERDMISRQAGRHAQRWPRLGAEQLKSTGELAALYGGDYPEKTA